ncbi:MAG: hypothetical protein ABIF40_03605 [archaeon]
MMKKISDKWLYIPVLVLLVYLVFRFVDMSQLISTFPVYYTGDMPAYLSKIYFLDTYGYNNFVPNWYNGFILLKLYPPGFFFLTFPLFWLTGSTNFAFYLAMILLYVGSLIAVMFLAKSQGWSRIKGMAFYLFLLANPIAIGNFVRLGRMPELFGWICFIVLTSLLLYYKDRKLDKWFLLFIPFYVLLMLSHPAVITFFHLIFMFGILFLIKPFSQKTIIFLTILLGLVLSAFWWVPFVLGVLEQSAMISIPFGQTMLDFEGENLLSLVLNQVSSIGIVILLWLSYFFYWRTNPHKRRNIIYFLPLLLLSFLFFFRLSFHIPIINVLFPDIFFIGFMFFVLYFFFNTKFSKHWQRLIGTGIIILAILFVIISASHSAYFVGHDELVENAIDLLPFVENHFLVSNSPSVTLHAPFLISYATVYYNITSPYGSATHGMVDLELEHKAELTQEFIKDKDCEGLLVHMQDIDLQEIMTFNEHCETLNSCGLSLIANNKNVCLYSIYD